MKLRRATLIIVPILGIALYLTYLRLLPPADASRGTSTLSVSQRPPFMAPAGARPAASVDDVAGLREEVASLRAALSLLRLQQMPVQAASAGTESQSGADVRSRDLAREEAARAYQARVAAADSAFRKQNLDPTWSANTASAIGNALNSDDMGHIQADSIDCRSETCRVELHDDSPGRLSKNMPILAQELAGTLPNITANTVAQSNGGSTMVLYLSRQVQEGQAR